MTNAHFRALGAGLAFLAVALGAFGAHGLEDLLQRLGHERTWETASQYHFFHALAIYLVALREPVRAAIGWSFAAGIVFFSGSLYLLSVTDLKTLGAVTPIGGVLFLVGWARLAWSEARA